MRHKLICIFVLCSVVAGQNFQTGTIPELSARPTEKGPFSSRMKKNHFPRNYSQTNPSSDFTRVKDKRHKTISA